MFLALLINFFQENKFWVCIHCSDWKNICLYHVYKKYFFYVKLSVLHDSMSSLLMFHRLVHSAVIIVNNKIFSFLWKNPNYTITRSHTML